MLTYSDHLEQQLTAEFSILNILTQQFTKIRSDTWGLFSAVNAQEFTRQMSLSSIILERIPFINCTFRAEFLCWCVFIWLP